MGDATNLSFSTRFNQPKILFDSFEDVTVPALSITPDTLFTIPTAATTKPLPPRIFLEYNGTMTEASGGQDRIFETLGVTILFLASYNSLNSLVVRSFSTEPSDVDLRVYYRIYQDAQPS